MRNSIIIKQNIHKTMNIAYNYLINTLKKQLKYFNTLFYVFNG